MKELADIADGLRERLIKPALEVELRLRRMARIAVPDDLAAELAPGLAVAAAVAERLEAGGTLWFFNEKLSALEQEMRAARERRR